MLGRNGKVSRSCWKCHKHVWIEFSKNKPYEKFCCNDCKENGVNDDS